MACIRIDPHESCAEVVAHTHSVSALKSVAPGHPFDFHSGNLESVCRVLNLALCKLHEGPLEKPEGPMVWPSRL